MESYKIQRRSEMIRSLIAQFLAHKVNIKAKELFMLILEKHLCREIKRICHGQ
jgi:hypothetical protein